MKMRVVYKMNLHVVVTRCDSIYYDSIYIYAKSKDDIRSDRWKLYTISWMILTGNQALFRFLKCLIGWDTNGILYNVCIYESEPVCYGL